MRTINSFVIGFLSLFGALLFNGVVPQTANAMTITVNLSVAPKDVGNGGLVDSYLYNGDRWAQGSSYNHDQSTSPGAYTIIAGNTIQPTDFIVSDEISHVASGGFYSWLGQANQSAPFDQTKGNILIGAQCSMVSSTPITLTNATIDFVSSPATVFNQHVSYTSSDTYDNNTLFGLIWTNGVNRSGGVTLAVNAATPVNEIIWVATLGAGGGITAYNAPGPTNQQKLDNTAYAITHGGPGVEGGIGSFTETLSYNFGPGNIQSASKTVSVEGFVPEPATLALFAIGGFVIVSRRRRN